MTDQIPADKVREILDEWERIKEHADWDDIDNLVKDIRALIPAPPLPTLADMTPEERRACKRMQADTERWGRAVIIRPDAGGGRAALLDGWGDVMNRDHGQVTPRPDLPRLEWPGNQKPAPALPDGWRLAYHEVYGRVIVTRHEPDLDGEVAITSPAPTRAARATQTWCTPDDLTYLDTEPEEA